MELTAKANPPWSLTEKISFRFFCCLFLLYIFPFPLDAFPFAEELSGIFERLIGWYRAGFEAYSGLWRKFIPWVGSHILQLETPITIFTNGSGDTTYDYVLLLTIFALAITGCIIWSLLDRKRASYHTAYYWLRVLVRYYLAAVMMGYGFAKVFHLQMPFPYLSQLVQSFGDKSPMGLAWSFVGYSKGYSVFTGWAEVIPGILLLFRRTTFLGALIAAMVMLNVAMINYCYDVPVKLYSSMLFLMSVFLVAPDVNRLLNVFILNKSVAPAEFPVMVQGRQLRITRLILKILFIISTLYSNISGSLDRQKQYGDQRPRPPLYGIYNTELFVRNGDTVAPLTTDTSRWKQLVVQFPRNAQVKMMNDTMRRFSFTVDTSTRSITFFSFADTTRKSKLLYQADTAYLTIYGKMINDSVYMKLKKYDINNFRLVNRGFNWINEFPFNR